jgi:hypothetical protein
MKNSDFIKVHCLTTKLLSALQDKQAETSAVVFDELFEILSSVFKENNRIHEHYLCYGEALAVMLKYLVRNNYCEKGYPSALLPIASNPF